jgi:hypothetical protein
MCPSFLLSNHSRLHVAKQYRSFESDSQFSNISKILTYHISEYYNSYISRLAMSQYTQAHNFQIYTVTLIFNIRAWQFRTYPGLLFPLHPGRLFIEVSTAMTDRKSSHHHLLQLFAARNSEHCEWRGQQSCLNKSQHHSRLTEQTQFSNYETPA